MASAAPDLIGNRRIVGAAPDLGALNGRTAPFRPAPARDRPTGAPQPATGWDDPLVDTLEPWITVTSKVSKLLAQQALGKKGLS